MTIYELNANTKLEQKPNNKEQKHNNKEPKAEA